MTNDTPSDFSLIESVRRLVTDDDPRVGHCNAVFDHIGIAHTVMIENLHGAAKRIAQLLVEAGHVRIDATASWPWASQWASTIHDAFLELRDRRPNDGTHLDFRVRADGALLGYMDTPEARRELRSKWSIGDRYRTVAGVAGVVVDVSENGLYGCDGPDHLVCEYGPDDGCCAPLSDLTKVFHGDGE